jgi:hypothetical protein
MTLWNGLTGGLIGIKEESKKMIIVRLIRMLKVLKGFKRSNRWYAVDVGGSLDDDVYFNELLGCMT